MKEALFYDDSCYLCERRCKIPEGGKGFCKCRKKVNGKVYTLTYGKVVAINEDPIEKKPLYHFLPGSYTLSIATPGCNFRCLYCQNWTISQVDVENLNLPEVPPENIKTDLPSISYTYTEPTVFYEYAKDVAKYNKDKYHIFVTNGYFTLDLIKDMNWVDAFNIDLKGDNEFYEKVCKAPKGYDIVIRNIKELFKTKHVEVSVLIIPGYHDEYFIEKICKDLPKDIPLHLNAFHPDYKMTDVPPTPKETLIKYRKLALDLGMKYVYCGNIFDIESNTTYCPNCGRKLIVREFFSVIENNVENGACKFCGEKIYIT
jgi:pyruvate formate lyase activating enzyme